MYINIHLNNFNYIFMSILSIIYKIFIMYNMGNIHNDIII